MRRSRCQAWELTCRRPQRTLASLLLQEVMAGYATTTLSGDVAAAMKLLRRLTKPQLKAHKRGLILPLHELAAAEARTCVSCAVTCWLVAGGQSNCAFVICLACCLHLV